MRKRTPKLASYYTRNGAARYARDLAKAIPQYSFAVHRSPTDPFRYAVMVTLELGRTAWVAKCKRALIGTMFAPRKAQP